MVWAEIWKLYYFLFENFPFLEVKFSIYLNRRIFVMQARYVLRLWRFLAFSTVLSTSLGKTFFAWRFILNENVLLWLTISCQKPFVFSISVFCSQIFTLKLHLRPKTGPTYAISIVKWILEFLSKKIFFIFLCCIWFIEVLQLYCENVRKIEQVELVENLPPSYLPNRFLHNLPSFLLWENVKIFDLKKKKKKQWLKKVFWWLSGYDKEFCIKTWQKFANLLFLCKAQKPAFWKMTAQ